MPCYPGLSSFVALIHSLCVASNEWLQVAKKCGGNRPGNVNGGFWWAHQDLNLEPTDYESAALTN
jgi:hypothetical protein